MIANPYLLTADFSSVLTFDGSFQSRTLAQLEAAGYISDNLAQWRGLEQVPDYSSDITLSGDPGVLSGQGVWLTTTTNGTANAFGGELNIVFEGLQFMPEDGGEPRRDDPADGWDLELVVTSSDGEFGSQENFLGVREDASDLYDRYDFNMLPPPVSSFVQLYFPHFEDDWAKDVYRRDIRSLEFDGSKEWDFVVRTVNTGVKDYTLDWPGIDEVPENYSLTLYDVTNDREIGDMREIGQVSFRSNDDDVQWFQFRVTCDYSPEWVGPGSSSLPGGFGLTNAYPNPFNNVVNLEYTLPLNQTGSLKVYDMTGKLVDTIGNLQGEGTASWNAEGMNSGVYMMKLTSENQVSLKKVILMQ